MKILFIDWGSAGKKDLEAAFSEEGHSLIEFSYAIDGDRSPDNDLDLEQELSKALSMEAPDIVFSVNYFRIISKVCNKKKVKYISWVYDNPHFPLYSDTVKNPCNVIYIFDSTLYHEFHSAGISTVHYMPLAVNTERLDRIKCVGAGHFAYDVSFVGSLYLEKEMYYNEMMSSLSDYARGYVEGLMKAQLKIQGYNFIEETLGPVIQDMFKGSAEEGGYDKNTAQYLYAQYVINPRITAIERIELLGSVARQCKVDLFTHYGGFTLPGLKNHGSVDYYNEMPQVFKQSKINLNITLRSIKSGVPLRALDIMGSGGFLLSNFQADFLQLFVPGEDFVYYESKEDLLQKINYYLIHEKERMEIAKNGHDKVAAAHTYRHRVREMLNF